jgi:hypothetical protein
MHCEMKVLKCRNGINAVHLVQDFCRRKRCSGPLSRANPLNLKLTSGILIRRSELEPVDLLDRFERGSMHRQ